MRTLEHDTIRDYYVVQLVDRIIQKAILNQASDVHLEPNAFELRVRYRIDGMLHDQPSIELSHSSAIISRIKVLAAMNITDERLPQDGKFSYEHMQQSIDIRVSSYPTIFGQKLVIRLLDVRAKHHVLDAIGMTEYIYNTFKQLIESPQGLILVSGPTGSGKTTTLYAAISHINDSSRNIVTLEDPVEYKIDGITQGQVNASTGFTFHQGMRAILRQDPDVIMIGEIRDKESAHMAVEAALTGHLVLSTIHTQDAPSAVLRLVELGIEPFMVNAVLKGVLAQRLARLTCALCKVLVPISIEQRLLLGDMQTDQYYKGVGCAECNFSGTKKRTGIFELCAMTPELSALLAHEQKDHAILKTVALEGGMQTLYSYAMQKVQEGLISLEELIRICSI